MPQHERSDGSVLSTLWQLCFTWSLVFQHDAPLSTKPSDSDA